MIDNLEYKGYYFNSAQELKRGLSRWMMLRLYHVSAALPFILINPEPDVKLGTLSDYQKPESHPRKREYDFLVDRLYLEQVTD